MKAAVCHEFGTPLKIEDVDLSGPGQGAVRIKVAEREIVDIWVSACANSLAHRPVLEANEFVAIVDGQVVPSSLRPGRKRWCKSRLFRHCEDVEEDLQHNIFVFSCFWNLDAQEFHNPVVICQARIASRILVVGQSRQ